MIPVRQSTAVELPVGPVLDADGVAVTDCVVGDFKIKKTTGNFAALNGSATLTHVSAGVYDLVLTTSDVDTVGDCTVAIDDTVNACPMLRMKVVEEAVYDALFAASALGYVANAPVNVAQFGGTNGTFSSGRPEVNASHWGGTAVASTEVRANLINIAGAAVSTSTAQLGVNIVNLGGSATPVTNLTTVYSTDFAANYNTTLDAWNVNATAISGDTAAADYIQSISDGSITGTADSGTTTTMVDAARTESANDHWVGSCILFTSGSLNGQCRLITGFNAATDTITFAPATTQAVSTETYEILPRGRVDVHSIAGTAQTALDINTILVDTNELQQDWANGGRLDNILDARASQTSVDDLPTNSELSTALAAADDAVLAAIAALNNLSAAQVNAEMLDVLTTDTFGEPTGVPGATISLAERIRWLYMALRNKVTVTAGKKTFFDDSDAAEWEKDLTDDGTTYTESEGNAI